MTTTLICPCTFIDGKVYPDPSQECPNGHTRGQEVTMPKPRRRRTKTAVHSLTEGGFLVRGTDDPFKALIMVIESGESCDMEDMISGLEPNYAPVITKPPSPEELEEWKATAAHYFARLLNPANYRAGWFRTNPCPPEWCGEHGWHWDTAKGPGRGNFKGVVFE